MCVCVCVCDTLTGLRLGDMVSSSSGSMYVDRDPTSKVCLTAGDTSVNKVRISCLYRCNCCWAYDCSVRLSYFSLKICTVPQNGYKDSGHEERRARRIGNETRR